MSKCNVAFISLCLVSLAAGCGPGRTAAATQSTAKAFDPSKSEPKAIEIADQVMNAIGGQANWDKAKEIIWAQGLVIDGKLQDVVKHAWDRWNGRHQFTRWFGDGGQAVAMHELFSDTSFGYTQTEAGRFSQLKEDKEKAVVEAKRRFDLDTYMLFLPFKLKDPGVKLAFAQELPDLEATTADAPMKYDIIKITFDEGVGPGSGETWYLSVDKATHMPAWIEHVAAGKPDNERGGFRLEDWKEVGGLKFATRRVTLGYGKATDPKVPVQIPPAWKGKTAFEGSQAANPSETVLIQGLEVNASPNDELYIPDVKVSM
jgi:hypothetical protein